MNRRSALAIGIGVVVVAVLGFTLVRLRPWAGDSEPTLDSDHPGVVAIEGFVRHWGEGSLSEVTFAPGDENAADAELIVTGGLGVPAPGPEVEVLRVDRVDGPSERVRGHLRVAWDFGDDRIWSYETSITVVLVDDTWAPEWAPSVVHPSLRSGEFLRARHLPPVRGRILDAEGAPLTEGESIVSVGIRKSRADDPAETARQVAELTRVPLPELMDRLDRAGPDEFVEVIRLPRSAYDAIRDDLQPLPGTVFDEEIPEASVPAGYARSVLGSVGPATEEMAAESDGAVRPGDRIGLSGLQASLDDRLGGREALVIEAYGPDGHRVVETFDGVDGEDVRITLDRAVQNAADEVTADQEHPTSLVAVRVSTGEILAIGNGGGGYNRALLGRYPPGSAFKIVSAYALLTGTDLTPDTIVACPETTTVGKVFRNAEGAAYGDVPFRTDFARSCNTAFVDLSRDIDAGQLADAAERLGFTPHDVGLPAFPASVPTDGDETEHAAQMLGQGRVEGNVLDGATMAASIARGETVRPHLIVDDADPDPEPLDPEAVEALRMMMREVVTGGTGTILAGVPGGEVHAKTGTAEFGSASPPESHAWMVGYRGDIAFAVVVEGGGFGATAAGPIAQRFLTMIPDM